MTHVTVTREVSAPPAVVTDVLSDIEGLTVAGGFDEVTVEGDVVTIKNRVGLATMNLTLEVLDTDAALSLQQREGHFSEMHTDYEVEPADGGSRVTITTEFTLGRSIIGDLLDATVVRRQRTKELEAQLDWLQQQAESR